MGTKLIFSNSIRYWIIPISTVAILWFISGTAWYYYESSLENELQVETEVTVEQIKLRLESWVNHRIEIVENMASYWAKQETVEVKPFTQKAEELLSWIPGLQALNWIDENCIIKIVVPLEGNEPALGKNLNNHPFVSVQEALAKVQETKKISRTTAVELLQGGKGFAVYWPVLAKNGEITGYINGVFKIDQLIESCFSEPLLTERFSILFYEDNKVIYMNNFDFANCQSEFIEAIPVKLVDKNLIMKLIPTSQYVKALNENISIWILGFSLLLSLWLGYMLRISMLHNLIVKKSEERFRTVVEQAGDAFFLVSKKGEIVDVNQQACTELQYTKEELTSMTIKDIDEYADEEFIRKKIGNEINATTTFYADHKKKDGTFIPVEIRTGLIEINNEKYFLCLSRNISESKKLQELATRAQRLETAGQIAGQVAHDFNNLLAPLIAYPELIHDMLDDDHPAKELISKIEKSATQIAEINQQLLTLGRRGHYNQKIINLNDLIKHVIDEIELSADSCRIKTQFEQNLLHIKGGYSQIVRIINNLLHNSYDAIQKGGTISVKTENYYLEHCVSEYFSVPKGEYVKLTVSDNGDGIADDILPTIFDPFVSTKISDKKRGSGLGLSIVDSVIKDHNGYIDVKSKVGQGTEFYLYFPICREDLQKEKSIKVVGGNEKILIVDDDLTILEVTQKILEILGYSIKTAETGESALEMLQQESFDLLVLDMIIPNSTDGTETFKRALDINPDQKAIMVSGFAESDRVNEAMRLGVSSFIKKPFTKEIISKAIRDALHKETSVSM